MLHDAGDTGQAAAVITRHRESGCLAFSVSRRSVGCRCGVRIRHGSRFERMTTPSVLFEAGGGWFGGGGAAESN